MATGRDPARMREGFAPGRHAIDAYGSGGFRFADMSHQGSLLALPSGIHAWDADAETTIDEALFRQVLDERAGIDLLLIGSGKELRSISPALRATLAEVGLAFEVMPTAAAARTYTVLLSEDRRVAAALIAVT